MKPDSLEKLFMEQLKDTYSAEKQLIRALPKMAKVSSSPELAAAFKKHLSETENQVSRLETVFTTLGQKPKAKKCKAMEGLIKEADELVEEKPEPHVLDAGLICAAQKVEHYEIASYGSLCAWARLLGYSEQEQLLQETLEEEKHTDEALTELASSSLNEAAV